MGRTECRIGGGGVFGNPNGIQATSFDHCGSELAHEGPLLITLTLRLTGILREQARSTMFGIDLCRLDGTFIPRHFIEVSLDVLLFFRRGEQTQLGTAP